MGDSSRTGIVINRHLRYATKKLMYLHAALRLTVQVLLGAKTVNSRIAFAAFIENIQLKNKNEKKME